MSIFLVFLYVFNFRLIKDFAFSESSFLVLFFIAIYSLYKPSFGKKLISSLNKRYNKNLLSLLFLLVIISFVIPIIYGTFDFSYAKTLLHQSICIIIGMLLIALLNGINTNAILTLIYSFFAQSLVQLICFISPTILHITDIFRSEELIRIRDQSYRGFRGLAVSGSGFYGLAVSYGLLFVVLAFYFDKWRAPTIAKVVIVLCLMFGAISAGRTAIIGILVFLVVLITRIVRKLNKKDIKRLLMFFGTFIVVIVALYSPISNYLNNSQSWEYMHYYLFQFIENSNATGELSISNITSLNHMFKDMYFKLNPAQFILGDGWYTNADGSYYMHTDVGFLRNILFFGLFGTAFLYFYHFVTVFENAKTQQARVLAYCLFALTIIFEIKGQTMGFLIISQSMLLLICSNYSLFGIGEGEINAVD